MVSKKNAHMMQTFTVKIIIPDKSPKHIPNCIVHKGKVFQLYQKGIGEPTLNGGFGPGGDGEVWEEYSEHETAYRPYFNSTLFQEQGLTKEKVEDMLKKKGDEVVFEDERLWACLFEMGENPNGYMVINKDEEKRREEDEEQKRVLEGRETIDFHPGIFGLTTRWLPKKVWSVIAPHGEHHSGGEEDREIAEDLHLVFGPHEMDLKGWFYDDEAVYSLMEAGYPVSYQGHPVHNRGDLERLRSWILNEEKRSANAAKKYEKKKEELRAMLRDLFSNAVHVTKEEADELVGLEKVLFPSVGIEGPDIYGGGSWLHLTRDNAYLVRNNGGDGDDWSRNNYGTGGAGAICWRIPREGSFERLVQELKAFQKKGPRDFLEPLEEE